ncbi:NHLP bacteriocin system secretion protein [Opitutales bacterium]|nr:NHLP bacteriocin system secretion protein [Opitutales bacterium]
MSPPFRSDSTDSLVSTDDLDQASSLIKFRSFLFLAAFALLILIAIACSVWIKVPIKVSGPAVIWSDVGVLQVAAKDPGSVTSISVKVGDRIESGQVIAVLDQSRVRDQLLAVQSKLEVLNKYISDIQLLQRSDQRKRQNLKNTVDDLQKSSEALNKNRLLRLNLRKNELKKLYEDELIQFDQYHSFIDRIEEAEGKIIAEQRVTVNDFKEENLKYSTDARELLQKQLEADQLFTEVTLLESQLADQGKLKTLISGSVVEITTSVGDYLTPGSPVILVQPDPDEDKMNFVVFISSEQVKPVSLGMRTELEVSAFPPTKYGKLVAEVSGVSPMPMSSSGLMKELRNDQLVARITQAGSPFMVNVDILRDEGTGDFLWSSASAQKRRLQVGMVGEGSIITRYERLIWLLLPQTE